MNTAELKFNLERHWSAQCQMIGERNLTHILSELESGRSSDDWAVKKSGGTPMDYQLALSTLSTAIAFLQLAFKARDVFRDRHKRPEPEQLRAEISKLIPDANAPEHKILASEKAKLIINELAGKE